MSIRYTLLRKLIYKNIKSLGLPTDFKLILKGYSKTYCGHYKLGEITIYTLEKDNSLISMDDIMETAIHEAIHHYQWCHLEGFVRVKGVMHNKEFKQMEKKYLDMYYKLKIEKKLGG